MTNHYTVENSNPTYISYSTIWMAQGLPPDGHITTLEISQKHAEVRRHSSLNTKFGDLDQLLVPIPQVALENIKRAGFSNKIEVIVGPGADTLKTLDSSPPYDFVFIDADKPSNVIYFEEAKRLVKKGGVIVSLLC